MIIDMILDRKDCEDCGWDDGYNAKDFYDYCMEESTYFDGIADDITRAMDCGGERDVRAALCAYVKANDYNLDICDYINKKEWISPWI